MLVFGDSAFDATVFAFRVFKVDASHLFLPALKLFFSQSLQNSNGLHAKHLWFTDIFHAFTFSSSTLY